MKKFQIEVIEITSRSHRVWVKAKDVISAREDAIKIIKGELPNDDVKIETYQKTTIDVFTTHRVGIEIEPSIES